MFLGTGVRGRMLTSGTTPAALERLILCAGGMFGHAGISPSLFGEWKDGTNRDLPAPADPAERPVGVRGTVVLSPNGLVFFGSRAHRAAHVEGLVVWGGIAPT